MGLGGQLYRLDGHLADPRSFPYFTNTRNKLAREQGQFASKLGVWEPHGGEKNRSLELECKEHM